MNNTGIDSLSTICVRDLHFSFGHESLFRDFTFEVAKGDFVSILGASGCGKSTLLRLIAGLLQPTSGSVQIGDQAAEQCKHQLGFVFQQPTLCPWRSVRANVELPLQLRNMPQQARRIRARDAIRLVDLAAADESKLPRQLSGGMQMRASIARALVTEPDVMLMDEPFSALDEVLRQQLCETCLDLWRREKWTGVFVTHNVTEAVFMSQRVYILAGSPSKLVDTIEVPFDNRDTALRTSPEFFQFVADVSQRLRTAVEVAGTQAESVV